MTPRRASALPLDEGPGTILWQLRNTASEDCRLLAEALRIHPVTATVLVARGWNTPALAARFLNPDWADILDPSHLPDFNRAIDRLIHAIQSRENIMVFGDYDVDGLTATGFSPLP